MNYKDYDQPLEEYTGETTELSTNPVNLNELFKKVDINKTEEVFKKTQKKSKNVLRSRPSTHNKSINAIIREIIREEVRNALEDYASELEEKISNLIINSQIK